MKRKYFVIFVTLSLLLAGCGTWTWTRSLFVTGVSIETVGNQFVQISAQITSGCIAGAIQPVLCEKYRVFGEHFKKVYPTMVGIWQAAKTADDRTTRNKAEDSILKLSEDLSLLATEALANMGGK